MKKYSAGIILFHRDQDQVKILLGHMGGPFWSRKDEHAWTIPKGEFDPENENPEAAARREFEEETGLTITDELVPINPFTKNNKQHFFYLLGKNVDHATLQSNSFAMEWPPKSGTMQSFPELDRFGWFDLEEAKIKLVKGQFPIIDKIEKNPSVFSGE